METFTDNFDANIINTSLWHTNVSAGTISVVGGQLNIAPPPSSTEYDGYLSNGTYDLTSSQISITCVQTLSNTTGCEQSLGLKLDSSNAIYTLYTGAGAGGLGFRIVTAGSVSDVFVTWDSIAMKWWKIRESGGTIYWETSPDGSSWTVQRSASHSFSVTSLDVELYCGSYVSIATPGVGIFDNLNTVKTSTISWLSL